MSRKYLAFATVFALVALSACSKATDVVTDAANTVTDGVGNIADSAMDAAGDAMEATGDAVMDAGEAVADVTGDAMEATGDVVEDAAAIVGDVLDPTDPANAPEDAMMEDDKMMDEDAAADAEEEGAMMEDDKAVMEPTTGTYTGYVDGVIGNGQESVLFFHAAWCPTCVAEDTNFVERASNENLSINVYKLDYDSNTELRTQFGVTNQHTLVHINGEGEVIESITGPTAEQIEAMVNPV